MKKFKDLNVPEVDEQMCNARMYQVKQCQDARFINACEVQSPNFPDHCPQCRTCMFSVDNINACIEWLKTQK